MPLLELKSVSVGYGHNRVLHNVDLALERGEIVTLLGANGAGKSTLVKSISGLLRTEAGTILLDGEPIQALSAAERLRRGIAHIPEGRQIFAGMTVAENLGLRRLGLDAVGRFEARGADRIHRRIGNIAEQIGRVQSARVDRINDDIGVIGAINQVARLAGLLGDDKTW